MESAAQWAENSAIFGLIQKQIRRNPHEKELVVINVDDKDERKNWPVYCLDGILLIWWSDSLWFLTKKWFPFPWTETLYLDDELAVINVDDKDERKN